MIKRLVLPSLAVAAVSAVLFLPLCNLLHRCGCRPPWSGAAAHCNVQQARGPHCPWCEHSVLGGAATVLILGTQLLVYRAVKQRSSTKAAVAAAILSLPMAAVVVAVLLWLPTDYPHFLVQDARSRLGLPKGPIPSGR